MAKMVNGVSDIAKTCSKLSGSKFNENRYAELGTSRIKCVNGTQLLSLRALGKELRTA
jgi:hypothetical protein